MLDFSAPFLAKGDKLICFGDSLTAQEGSYVGHLQNALPDNEIINAGRGGDKTTWALTRLEQDVLSQSPDAVLIMLGTNDAAVGRAVWADEPTIPPEAYLCNLKWIAHFCRLKGIQKISIATPFGFEGPSFIEQGRIMEPYALAAREAADQMQARLVPLDALFDKLRKGAPLSDMLVTRDGTHPTPEIQKEIAQTMLKAWSMDI
ncbi:MAG: hypothetical protein IKC65_05995 [Lentisphaeria bacterium]|nr:hypothetical protein [Lentisphaeria bacterium]